MLDMNTGKVAHAVLAFGGFLGMGEKLFAVPWQALRRDTVTKRFVLNMDKERLQNAPGFNEDAWPDVSDVQWARRIDSFYGIDPSRGGASGMGAGMGTGASMGGSGAGDATDPRPGSLGDDADLSRVRGSNPG